jgi:hypothetical protein
MMSDVKRRRFFGTAAAAFALGPEERAKLFVLATPEMGQHWSHQ